MEQDFPGVINWYLAIDPGDMTGVATMTNGDFHSTQAPLNDVLDWVYDTLLIGTRPVIFCEDFIITPETAKKSRQTSPTDGIGALKWMAHMFDVTLTLQTPAAAKKFADDKKLKALGWYRPTKGGHANDAARHLMLGLVKNKIIDPRQLLPKEDDDATG